MDNDTVDEIHDAVAAGLSHSCQAYVRAQGDKYSAGFGQDMSGRKLSRYLASIDLTFRTTGGDIGLTLDGTRAGNPAEENIVSMLWHCSKEIGAAMPIKAPRIRKNNMGKWEMMNLTQNPIEYIDSYMKYMTIYRILLENG